MPRKAGRKLPFKVAVQSWRITVQQVSQRVRDFPNRIEHPVAARQLPAQHVQHTIVFYLISQRNGKALKPFRIARP